MGRKGQLVNDVIKSVPKRLQTISNSFGYGEFSLGQFNKVSYEKGNDVHLDRLRINGWLNRVGLTTHYKYRLSKKAFKYKREFGSFMNPKGSLFQRWQD